MYWAVSNTDIIFPSACSGPVRVYRIDKLGARSRDRGASFSVRIEAPRVLGHSRVLRSWHPHRPDCWCNRPIRLRVTRSNVQCCRPSSHWMCLVRRIGREVQPGALSAEITAAATPLIDNKNDFVGSLVKNTVLQAAITAPVSHQKRLEREATDPIKRVKSSGKSTPAIFCPAAHNGLVGGSNPPGPTTQSEVCGDFPEVRE